MHTYPVEECSSAVAISEHSHSLLRFSLATIS